MKLLVNCRAYDFDPATRAYVVRDTLLVDGLRIAGCDGALAGAGVERVDAAGATIVPAFADCHLHLTDTGYTLADRDFSGVRDADGFAVKVAALPRGDEFLLAGKNDYSLWREGAVAVAQPLERFQAERYAMLVRVDCHSCLVNRKTFAFLDLDPALEGIERDAAGEPTGRLFLAANWTAQTRFLERIPLAARRAAEARATALALSEGALHLHVQLIGLGSREAYAAEIAALPALGPANWHPKICERDPELAASLGLPYVGGDVFLDGSLGSGTAALGTPYCDRPGSGVMACDDATVFDYFSRAEAAGISAGVHAIGDRAIEQCIATWERVLGGRPSSRNRHFVEHFELATPAQIERAARLGLFLSMQPQFDADWGGDSGMYATRLGGARSLGMNALGSALRAGAVLCGGDDSPVCRLSPLAGMAAACEHHNPAERLGPLEALTMYTYDAARFGHAERRTGRLAAGYDADLVFLDRDPFAGASFKEARVLQTWRAGEPVFQRS
ncbi:MAG: amidohydrolase [Vulcanimicrobiaceae bacterium]